MSQGKRVLQANHDLYIDGAATSRDGTGRSLWISAAQFENVGSNWSFINGSGPAWSAVGGTGYVNCGIELPYNAARAAILTAVSFRIHTAGGVAAVGEVFYQTGLSTSSAPSIGSQGSANSSGTGDQTLVVSALSLTQTADRLIYLQFASGQVSDILYGALVTYQLPLL